jgi:hypothetical protein
VHRDVVSEALGLVQTWSDDECVQAGLLDQLEDRLIAALTGVAS